MKNLLKYYLFDKWTDIFSSSKEGRIKLTTEDYVVAIEILQEAESIPHGFRSLLSYLFRETNAVIDAMWFNPFQERTQRAMKVIFEKTLKNPYKKNSKEYSETEPALVVLRRLLSSCSDKKSYQLLYKKIELLYKKSDDEKWQEIGELVGSWD